MPSVATPTRPVDPSGLGVLSSEECERLLTRSRDGRLAFLAEGRPVVVPLCYHVAADGTLLGVSPAGRVAVLADGRLVALEVSGTGDERWSVVLHGRAEVVPASRVPRWPLSRLPALLGRGPRPEWLRIIPEVLRGRTGA